MAHDNLATAERFTQAVYAGDQASLRALLEPNFVMQQDKDLPYGGEYRGADGFLAFLSAFGAAFEVDSLQQTNTFIIDSDPDQVVFEFSFKGKVRATGMPFDTTVLERWSFRNGRILAIMPHWFEVPAASLS